jgi:hypothetical protein
MIKTSILIIMTMSMILSIIAITETPSTAYAGKDSKKELCKENGGEWKDGRCDFKTDDEDKTDQFSDDVKKIEKFDEDKADLEDALCDDPEDSKKFDVCQSATLAFAYTESDEDDDNNQPNTKEEDEEYAKELCESDMYNGEWKDGECTNFPNGRDSAWMGFGDECEDSDFQKKHPYFCKVKE